MLPLDSHPPESEMQSLVLAAQGSSYIKQQTPTAKFSWLGVCWTPIQEKKKRRPSDSFPSLGVKVARRPAARGRAPFVCAFWPSNEGRNARRSSVYERRALLADSTDFLATSSREYSWPKILWERAKRGATIRLFGVRLSINVRRATPLAMNRMLLLRRKVFRALTLVKQPPETHRYDSLSHLTTSTRVTGVAVIVGIGQGLGTSLVKCLSDAGMRIAGIARDKEHLAQLREANEWPEESVRLYACDAANETSFNNALSCISLDLGTPNLVIYLVQASMFGPSLDIEPTALEDAWRANCLGAFIVARSTSKLMAVRGSGTLIFAGATSGIIGRAGYLGLAVGKFALRALSQVMARELWPQGIHVAHVIIDGGSFYFGQRSADSGTDPEAAANTFLMIHNQPKNSWTHELDLRPWNEHFWEHC